MAIPFKYFSFADGERLAGVICHDPRSLPKPVPEVDIEDPNYPPPYELRSPKKAVPFDFRCRHSLNPPTKWGAVT